MKDSVKTVYSCRICAAQKGDGNHWYIVECSDLLRSRDLLKISPWLDGLAECLADDPDLAAICSDKCLHTAVSRWTETRTFDPPPVRSEAVALPDVAPASTPAGPVCRSEVPPAAREIPRPRWYVDDGDFGGS